MNQTLPLSSRPIPGGWKEHSMITASQAIRLLVPANPDEFLDSLSDDLPSTNLSLADPYWVRLWPTAEVFAKSLPNFRLPKGANVLELGCGIGLVGFAALAEGCRVTFSDYVPEAVELALENAQRNSLPWASGLVLDWQSPIPTGQQFEVILGSDILYDRNQHGPLLAAISQLLAPGGVCLLADPGRHTSEDFLVVDHPSRCSFSLLDMQNQPLATFQDSAFQVVKIMKSAV